MIKNFFNDKSKADVIEILKNKKLKFYIPKTLTLSVEDWKINKKYLLNIIQEKFGNRKNIAIRSSSKTEDKITESQAGKFSSYLNVPIKNSKKIISSINSVIKSYGKEINKNDQVFIQEMVSNVSVSGVIFTKDIDTGLNYYIINYDDISGKTDTVTSGKGIHSNRTLFIFKKFRNNIKSPRFKKLIKCVQELENKLENTNLDIEFAVTKNLKPFLLQVRPITTIKNWDTISLKNHEKYLIKVEKKLKKIFEKKTGILGKKTILGQMPDWNPVEMIGKYPSILSYSLYKNLITNKIWAMSRAKMGYRDMSKHNLMYQLCGQPFIDTRLSLNSFLPKKLPSKIATKLINFGIEELEKNPQFHDKVEFETSFPSYTFDLNERMNKKLGELLSKNEKKIFCDELKSLTLNFMNNKNPSSYNVAMAGINYLDKIYEGFNKYDITQLPKLMYVCKKYGTFNFSILARHGFVARSFLNSLISKSVISSEKIEKFEQSLNTITKNMLIDLNKVQKNRQSSKNFMRKYGHLRPGSYDITSKRYDQIKISNFKIDNKKIKKIRFKLSNEEIKNINNVLKANGFKQFNYEKFFNYISSSISLREFSKFVFTKYLSLILEIIANYGKKNNLNRNELANINISYFLKKKHLKNPKKLKNLSLKNQIIHKKNQIVKLPILIQDISRTRIIPYQISSPNFITRKKVEGEILFNPDIKKSKGLKNKIIFIENADPGYDWLFGFDIKGLVTKYGGKNSHMSIRCSELGIPAAIGCGEQIFSELVKKKSIYLDCLSSAIYSV